MMASQNGHTEIVLALLAAAGIDVNHANVSIYPLTPSYIVVGGEVKGCFLPFPLTLTLVLINVLSPPPTTKMYPITKTPPIGIIVF